MTAYERNAPVKSPPTLRPPIALGPGSRHPGISLQSSTGVRNCKGQHLEAGYMDRGVAIPNLQALAKGRRPDGASMQFLGFTTATHGRDDY